MTEESQRSALVAAAKRCLGLKESDGSYQKIIDLYNSHTPLAQGYRLRYTDSWCAAFVSAAAISSGLTDIIPTECSCPRQVKLFQALGCWQENDAYVPKPGDILYYDWSDTGTGDDTASPDHVGIVTAVKSGRITVIEGNLSNAVGYRNIGVNAKFIRGYGVPRYGSATAQTTVQETAGNSKTTAAQAASGEEYEMAKTYRNGSTSEPVYADTDKLEKIGSLNACETCDCLGRAGEMYIVRYRVDGTSRYKVGLVSYSGGVADS